MLILFFTLFIQIAPANELRPFVSDGCTMAPDGTFKRPGLWRSCCEEHDLRFWGGGTKIQRQKADQDLKECVEQKAGKKIAEVFFRGVQLGSLSPFKLPSKKWGNAWFEAAGYRELSSLEISQLLIELDKLDIPETQRTLYRSELLGRLNP
jgi:hypothetical protein